LVIDIGYLAACTTGQVALKLGLSKFVPATTSLSVLVEPTQRALDLADS
jgi:hypothetical protein